MREHSSFYHLLKELAIDLHWSWNHATDKIWRQLDPTLWELTHNPFVVLQTVSQQRIKELMQDPIALDLVNELVEAKCQRSLAPAWFQHHHPQSRLTQAAYFSMEFMLSEALPIYSGGLGNVAGDHLKTASDLGVPVIGIGLLFQQGYSRQVIYKNGDQRYVTPYNDPGQLPVKPLRDASGEWVRIEVKLLGHSVWIRCWTVQVGRTILYLLDSNDAANFSVHRGITGELYASGSEERLLQELVLGIGGWLLLEELGLSPEVCHMNEGHAAFVVVERAVKFMDKHRCDFNNALFVTRAGNIFTTHTAVGAGFDLFSPELVLRYLGDYIRNRLKITESDFLALGRKNVADDQEPFNTAYLAIHGSCAVNGVSRLHGDVSRQLFAPLFPRWPLSEVPVNYVTNGVHMPTWDSAEADKLWTEACGKERWLGTLDDIEQNIQTISDDRLWAMRTETKRHFIDFVRQRHAREQATIGASMEEIKNAEAIFDPAVLTIGFARRFVSYKRPNLLLQDKERLKKILCNKEKPVQLIIAGKAHRMDSQGHSYIKEWCTFIEEQGLKERIVFLNDYDMLLCEHMVQGVDLWINTPRRPWEACGTSGMKVLVNGGLNLSVSDGWWDEAYSSEVGWKIGQDHPLLDSDEAEAEQLYVQLEEEIIPRYYQRNAQDIPVDWVSKIRLSMAHLTPRFSANRSLREYTEKFYLPAATSYSDRKQFAFADNYAAVSRYKQLREKWREVSFTGLQIATKNGQHQFCTQVRLGSVSTDEILVQLYADRGDESPEIYSMSLTSRGNNDPHGIQYSVSIPSHLNASDFTPRVISANREFMIPLECSLICWQR